MRGKIAIVLFCAAFASAIFMSGCSSPQQICGQESGKVLCGYCYDDRAATGNPHGGQCRYCPSGYQCAGDVCGEIACLPSGSVSGGGTSGGTSGGGTSGGGGTSKTYYCSCSQCKGAYSTYSYRGPSYGACNGYYQACVMAQCGKILDNCR